MISSSSSNRTPGQCDAVLTTNPHAESVLDSARTGSAAAGRTNTGPLRLPMNDPASFVTRFNRIYAKIGLSVQSVPASDSYPSILSVQKVVMSDDVPSSEISPETLRQKQCVPCEGGVPAIESEAAGVYMQSLPNWSIDDGQKCISRRIDTGTFEKAMGLMRQIADLAESEQHHPDLHLTGYRNLQIDLTTHTIGGLSENDFVVAAKIDTILD